MKLPVPLPANYKDVVAERLPDFLDKYPSPDGKMWLTFYIFAPEDRLINLGRQLRPKGWVGVEEQEFPYSHVKQQTSTDVASVLSLIDEMRTLCDELGVMIDMIDADTSHNVTYSKFMTLYLNDRPKGLHSF